MFRSLSDLRSSRIHFIGIKGSGMTALAELFRGAGAEISGSDVPVKFYTDSILDKLGIEVLPFDAGNIPPETDAVVFSPAYTAGSNPEMAAAQASGIPMLSYPEALGLYSSFFNSTGISGVHGKTTTAAMSGTVMKHLRLPAVVLAATSVPGFGGGSTYIGGDRYFIAETCEYRRHFLNFHPGRIVMTSIEEDHLDYFRDLDDILDAFTAFALRLPERGELIYCGDDPGACRAAGTVGKRRPDIGICSYGFGAGSDYIVRPRPSESGRQSFRLGEWDTEFTLYVPGRHNMLNASAAALLTVSLLHDLRGETDDGDIERIRQGLSSFRGTKRRCEILAEKNGVLYIDDYAHHPTAIKTTLSGLKDFYRPERLIVDFMPHLYSRTEALLDDFASSFGAADIVILNKIYASARESGGNITGETLFAETKRHHKNTVYFAEPLGAVDYCRNIFRNGDLFVTMGAGDNWVLSHTLAGIDRD